MVDIVNPRRSVEELLAEDFEKHGEDAIRAARLEDPIGFLRLIASVCGLDEMDEE